MKPTRDTAYLTIATSIINILVLIVNYTTHILSPAVPDDFRYLFSFIPVMCFSWFVIFVISILRYFNEKPFIINTFIIYLIYSFLRGLIDIGISFSSISTDKIVLFYQINGFINLFAVISILIMTFLLSPTAFRLPLRLFALSEFFMMIFYMTVPPLIALLGSPNYVTYVRYLGFVYLIIPGVELYIAVTALNVINKQLWQKPFSETENPDWPPYNKPNL